MLGENYRRDVLVVEISGKRPGTDRERPTEKFYIPHDHIIISNNCEGYETNWDIVEVPQDFRDYYVEHYKMHKSAYYAPMNRSYAIKYAREHGYKYCVQLDDNIKRLEIRYRIPGEIRGLYRTQSGVGMMDDYIEMLCCVLDNTNAGMAGCSGAGFSPPSESMSFLVERYCYSLFAIKLNDCPDYFQGDFEDDIEYRIKLAQMGKPVVQVEPLSYSKTGQRSSKDESGCRAAYTEAGASRGDHMRVLNGDIYSAGLTSKPNGFSAEVVRGGKFFRHQLTPWKVGIVEKNRNAMNDMMREILTKNAPEIKEKYILRSKKAKA